MHFKGVNVLITGASSGIGKATVEKFAKQKANVALVARDVKAMKAIVKSLSGYGGKFLILKCDVRNYSQVKVVVKKVLKKFGTIDILVNNAGIGIYSEFEKQEMNEIREQIETNLYGVIYFTKEILPGMLKQGRGEIVNVSSMAGKIPFPNYSIYCATKFAVAGFT
ncbi:MAG: SDR family NAD(P)-dependent oxidoreductase, partial [Candidatus Diapherotrites archaeon]|nr:SDR family NAD(P)-dependent oxidoreductase [Candidatus Diapherotrites archaeon]